MTRRLPKRVECSDCGAAFVHVTAPEHDVWVRQCDHNGVWRLTYGPNAVNGEMRLDAEAWVRLVEFSDGEWRSA